jgi:hypothetical protein
MPQKCWSAKPMLARPVMVLVDAVVAAIWVQERWLGSDLPETLVWHRPHWPRGALC